MPQGKCFLQDKKRMLSRIIALSIPVIIALLLLSQTVLAQNTYIITDGSRRLVHTTYATDPVAVLGEAGFALNENDTYTEQRGADVSEITVRRGESSGKAADVVPAVESLQMIENYTENIPHTVSYYKDPSLPAGAEKVLVKGQDGEISCSATVSYVNGEEVDRTVLKQTVIQQPVAAVIAVGAGSAESEYDYVPAQPVIGDGYIVLPTGEVLTYTDTMKVGATAYSCENWRSIPVTATGTMAREGVVAVDPSVIPYGTRMFIVSNDGQYVYGVATAEDTGDPGFIRGNRVDLYYDTIEECVKFGYRECTVYFLGETEIEREYSGW